MRSVKIAGQYINMVYCKGLSINYWERGSWGYGFLPSALGHSHYILRMTSPPMSWNCVRREKKVAISAFFLFFPPTC